VIKFVEKNLDIFNIIDRKTMTQQVRLGELLGDTMEEEFVSFDMTEIQQVLDNLKDIDAIDLAHAELLQQQSLRAADILVEYLAKIVKTVAYLEAKVNSTKNKVSMDYTPPDGGRATLDMRKWAAEVSPEVAEVQNRLAAAKGSKVFLERKYEILVKAHHHFKDIAMGMRKTILGYSSGTAERTPSGWE
jgi:dimeric dUTPase (all-alpha-NTP-PPase superfamily)